jgi:hypothetical protein
MRFSQYYEYQPFTVKSLLSFSFGIKAAGALTVPGPAQSTPGNQGEGTNKSVEGENVIGNE